jgi:asparagine synthase (glutamine-hydrolysing)
MEWYIADGTLIAKSDWEQTITTLRSDVAAAQAIASNVVSTSDTTPTADIEREWIAAFERAVLVRAREAQAAGKKIGVLFSGGLDSSLIALSLQRQGVPFTCYAAGFLDGNTKEPDDIMAARTVAAHHGWPLKTTVLDELAIAPMLRETTQLLGDVADPVSVGIACVVLAAVRLAERDAPSQALALFGGLGAEEIFAGYHRHAIAHARGVAASGERGGIAALDEESWRGFLHMYSRDLLRDTRLVFGLRATGLDLDVPTPFLDRDVIVLAMRMPPQSKIADGVEKAVLRRMALVVALHEPTALRPKKAAQYGSRTHKAIFRLAKKAGLTEEQYVAQLRT